MKEVMIDLETLGTAADSVILSIGAVRFDSEGGELGEVFYRRVDIDSCLFYGLHVKGRTLLWWLEQSEKAREAIYSEDGISLFDALSDLSDFIQEGDRVWGNGAAFDNAILAYAYSQTGIPTPWPHYNDRCYRTIKNLVPDVRKPTFEGIEHNALDDAINQAKHLQAILSSLQTQAVPLNQAA
jgi:hypothetical protein